MRRIITNTFCSLDGVIQAPGGPEEDRSDGFKYGGWSVHHWDTVMEQFMARTTERPYDLLLGRKTYEIFAAHWPFVDGPMAEKFSRANKYVATTSLEAGTWENTVLLQGDVVAALRSLKAEEGIDMQLYGSSGLMQTLMQNDLIDEMNVWMYPLVLGNGKRLFGNGVVPRTLRLVEGVVSGSGVMLAKYEPAGSIVVGSFALDPPTELELARRARVASGEH